jgi:hypothetical protein
MTHASPDDLAALDRDARDVRRTIGSYIFDGPRVRPFASRLSVALDAAIIVEERIETMRRAA